MRYLVTGAAGFIGSHYVRMLLGGELDVEVSKVTVVDKLTYAGDKRNLESVMDDQRFEFVQGDICDSKLVRDLMSDMDVVVNFAAESHVDRSISDASSFVRTNVLGAQVVFDAARDAGVARVVHIGTDEVYGSIESGSWNEKSPLQPNSPYAASKAAAEHFMHAYAHTYGLNISSTRCSNNYGPHQFPEKLVPLFVTNLLDRQQLPMYGDGLNTRDWLHVSDHCRGIQIVVSKGDAGQSYNIGGGRELTNRQLTEMIIHKMHRDWDCVEYVPDRLGHDRRYSVDDALIRSLGYSPQVNFDSGLDQTIEWYVNNESWWRKHKSDG
ncbi:MAG: dTDP-glucose 4,6-dehydratase [Actinobacteria bacterium]|uniref:Unannotated protein n=1 Tax=freshwater metagenome TaxID=449393 RepID=A0A6J5Z0F9_9ZZZZ|nr:dTDP-glucose 4,6-dehydratase [Actinomycetota bacterium]